MVLVPQKWIDTNPAAVQAFYDATQRRLADYLNRDPRPGNALIKRDNPDMTDAIIAQSLAKMKQYQSGERRRCHPAYRRRRHDGQALAHFYARWRAKAFIPRGWITQRRMTCASCAARRNTFE